MTPDRDELRRWLQSVLSYLGWSGNKLAQAIKVSPSTINRFLNDPAATHSLSSKNLNLIEKKTGFKRLEFPGSKPLHHLEEPEALPFDITGASAEGAEDFVAEFCAKHQNVDPWVLRTNALEGAGFFAGDILLVDLSAVPQPHDLVCAQIYDWKNGSAQTIFRIFLTPYLLAPSVDPELMRPYVVDNDSVVIKGVVLQSIRRRRSDTVAA